jgi:GntR family transcriptional repressor for pyruvate dehydrogenase complex
VGVEFRVIKQKSSISQQVLDNIKESIMDGTLRPGDKLPALSEIAATMGVGISSVREAVKMLEILDILETKQGDGTFVASGIKENAFNALSLQFMLMPRCVEQLVEFRKMFETAFTHLAMENATPEDFMDLEEIVIAQEKKFKTDSPTEEDEKDFHLRVLRSTHNPYIIRMCEPMLELFLSTLPTSAQMLTKESVSKDHRKLLECMRSKNPEGINKVLKKSFDGWGERLNGTPYVEAEETV